MSEERKTERVSPVSLPGPLGTVHRVLTVDVDRDDVYQVGGKVKRCHQRVVRTVSPSQLTLTLQI